MLNKDNDFDLNIQWKSPNTRKYAFACISIFIIIITIYSNSFNCSWHYDDNSNIVNRTNVHMKGLSRQDLIKTFYDDKGKITSRPIAYLSYAINYYFGQTNVWGYHLVNILIHYITTTILFLLIFQTLNLPHLREKYGRNSYSLALLSTVFWSISPVHVSAITFIVQRMTSMAAMFYIMAMYLYLKARSADKMAKGSLYFILSFISTLLAFGTKEISITLPFSIYLYDLFLIQGINKESLRKNLIIGFACLIVVAVVGVVYNDFNAILSEYKYKTFSMIERLLTEPRVIIFYLTLIFYPTTSRLTLLHDFAISKSLIDPWTTAPAIVIIFLIIFSAFFFARKKPLISFCILFFFLNHALEASIFPIDLVHEHRNYLPSMFIFIPVAILIVSLLDYFVNKKLMLITIFAAITSLIIIYGITVWIQNGIYRDGISLWKDNSEKYPDLYAPHQNLAANLLLVGKLSESFSEMQKALAAKSVYVTYQKFHTFYTLGNYFLIKGEENKALIQFHKSLELSPELTDSYYAIAQIMIHKGAYDEAEMMIKKALAIKPQNINYNLILSDILVKKGNPDAAIKKAQTAIKLNIDESSKAFSIISEAFNLKKDQRMSEHYQKLATHPLYNIYSERTCNQLITTQSRKIQTSISP